MATSPSPVNLPEELKAILARPLPLELSSNELSRMIASFTTPTSPTRTISLAVLARALSPTPSSTTLASLRSTLDARLSGTDSRDLIEGLSTLSAVLQVAPSLAVSLLTTEGSLRSHVEDTVEIITSPKGSKNQQRDEEELALVELLALASGQSGVRKLVRRAAGKWLESLLGSPGKSSGRRDDVRALAGVAVIKLRLGTERPEEGGGVAEAADDTAATTQWELEDLAKLFTQIFVATAPTSKPNKADTTTQLDSAKEPILLASLEALAYLTLVPSTTIKPLVAIKPLLVSLFSLLPVYATNSALDYAVATLLDHLTAFPPPVDAASDAAQIQRLKASASAKSKTSTPPPAESTATINARIALVVSLEPLPTVRQLVLSTSLPTRRLAACILHSLVTPTPSRGTLLQAGAARQLLSVVRQLPTPFDPAQDVPAIQGLAKLLITTNPLLVFGPGPDSPLLREATLALLVPLSKHEDPSVGLLTAFECLMALTNVSSLDQSLAEWLAAMRLGDGTKDTTGSTATNGRPVLRIVEELMINSNTMVRRAATELLCNLAASDAGIGHFRPSDSTTAPSKPSAQLHLVLALSSSPDLPTRLAASGALTSLVLDPSIALAVTKDSKGLDLLLGLLEENEAGLRHRALDVLRSIARGVDKNMKQELREGAVGAALRKAEQDERVGELKEVAKEALGLLTS